MKNDSKMDWGLLLLRLGFGGFMAFGHGLGKLQGFQAMSGGFPDPLGIGSTASLVGAIGGELFACLLLMVGFMTRLATIPAIFTMLIAAFMIHGSGPLFLPAEGAKEPALIYAFAFAALALMGPGKFSVDAWLAQRNKPAEA